MIKLKLRSLTAPAAVLCLVLGASAAATGEQGRAPQIPAPPTEPRAAKAFAVFGQNCARCHQAGPGKTPVGGLAAILDLARLAADTRFVTPGLPDGSRLYTVMLERHAPLLSEPEQPAGTSADAAARRAQSVRGPLLDKLTAADLEAVRDWIATVQPTARPTSCAARSTAEARSIRRALEADLWTADLNKARNTRFLMVPVLDPSCGAAVTAAGIRTAVAVALAAATTGLEPVTLREVEGTDGRLVAIDITRVAITADRWDRLASQLVAEPLARRLAGATIVEKTGSVRPVIAAELFAAALLAEPVAGFGSRAAALAKDATVLRRALQRTGLSEAALEAGDGRSVIEAVAEAFVRPIALAEAAAEVGDSADTLRRRLSMVGGLDAVAARQLMNGLISRARWLRLAGALDWTREADALSKPVATTEPVSLTAAEAMRAAVTGPPQSLASLADPPPRLALWTDKATYASGETIGIGAVADRTCYLTVLNVDQLGAATVIFPNAFQRDNRLEAGALLSLPGANAPFAFRARAVGRETIVGICTAHSEPPLALQPDWERQRFTVLGNWRAYLSGAFNGQPPVLLEPVPANNRRNSRSPPSRPVLEPFRPAGRAAVMYEVR